MKPRTAVILAALATLGIIVAGACSDSTTSPERARQPDAATPTSDLAGAGTARSFPEPPPVPDGPMAPEDLEAIETMVAFLRVGPENAAASLVDNADPRVLWILADVLRFTQGTTTGVSIAETASAISGLELDPLRAWGDLSDALIAWDIPAPADYEVFKGAIFTEVDPRWNFVFSDPDAEVDWRLLSWGGVLIDDRPLGDTRPCARGCIPALDDPALTAADAGDWYPDEAVVFGIEIDGDAVAFPRNIMEVHEMVNATIGGRRVALPYCTLCGSAQMFFTGEVPGTSRPLVMRTSGLLSRSNKVMYDLDSESVFDTFAGRAVTGPLRAAGVMLQQGTVVTTTWADWRATHPDTRIVAEDGGIGRSYPADPLRGRDDDGPIFPIGDVDDRLPVQEQVLGVETPDGIFVAFPVAAARAALDAGRTVEAQGVTVTLDGGGLRARFGTDHIASHQSFWFAWSQFHPDTELWTP